MSAAAAFRSFAKGTDVSSSRTHAELTDLLLKFGADGRMIGEMDGHACVAFQAQGRRILFKVRLPQMEDPQIVRTSSSVLRPPAARRAAVKKETDRIWRVLFLCIKAKIVAVADGVESFEDAFLAHVVMPDGLTVGEHTKGRIALAYQSGQTPPLLGAPS